MRACDVLKLPPRGLAVGRPRRCNWSLAGEGREAEPGWSGRRGGREWPLLPAVINWTDSESERYFREGYGRLLRELYHDSGPGRAAHAAERTPLLRRIFRDLHALEQRGGAEAVGPLTLAAVSMLLCQRGGLTGPAACRDLPRAAAADADPSAESAAARAGAAAMQSLARFGRGQSMLEVRQASRPQGPAPPSAASPPRPRATAAEYNAVMTLCLRRREWHRVPRLLRWMRAEAVAPDAATYDRLIAAAPGYAEGRKALGEMEADGLRPGATHYVSLISACRRDPGGADAALQGAEEALREARSSGLGPNSQHWDALLRCYAELGSLADTEDCLRRRQRAGVPMTGVAYTAYLAACAAEADGPGSAAGRTAERAFLHAVREGRQGQAGLYTALMRVYAAGGDAAKAESLLNSLLHGGHRHIGNTAGLRLLAAKAFAAAGEQDKAEAQRRIVRQRWRELGYSEVRIEAMLQGSPLLPSRWSAGHLAPAPVVLPPPTDM
eukprot:TRINITY_DN35471_c0_g1_i1.p1 TRINITY_DN35471_c0_g1~~TRINITY_DN35471_c0_g1_i1.p1  ORF type:complete len:497 (+),score=143.17 TRINITY_DN35471_c0_g1_i1:72-1562(+)